MRFSHESTSSDCKVNLTFMRAVSAGNIVFDVQQARFSRQNSVCFSEAGESRISHCLFASLVVGSGILFPYGCQVERLRNQCLDGYWLTGMRFIINGLLLSTLDRNLGRQTDGRCTRALRVGPRPCLHS